MITVTESMHILGVSDAKDASKIKKAFRKKAQELHPDKQNGCSDSFVRLKQAYDILMDHFSSPRKSAQNYKGQTYAKEPFISGNLKKLKYELQDYNGKKAYIIQIVIRDVATLVTPHGKWHIPAADRLPGRMSTQNIVIDLESAKYHNFYIKFDVIGTDGKTYETVDPYLLKKPNLVDTLKDKVGKIFR